MTADRHDSDMLKEYQSFAEQVQDLLRSDTQWQDTYAGYAEALMKNKDKMAEKRVALKENEDHLAPLCCYTTIGAVRDGKDFDFDLRFLGQSVGTIKVEDGTPLLWVDEEKARTSLREFGYDVGPIDGEDWNAGEKAKKFKDCYGAAVKKPDKKPRQPEHMVESALFTELGKKQGATKALKGIQPISCIPGVRLHMRTALAASEAAQGLLKLASRGNGGDIDVFCRRSSGNRSRLTVIEVKDKNERGETFHLAIKQAIAYAVFIRELARSKSGRDWMELWGLGNQPWEKGFTINAVAAMPKGNTEQFSFAGLKLQLKGGKPEGTTDWIELHYIAFLGEDQPRDGQDVRFETSL